MVKIRPASHPATNSAIFSLITNKPISSQKILDIGAGRGYMAQKLGDQCRKEGVDPKNVITACDLFPDNFEYNEIPCDKLKFISKLPYKDKSFDTVYAIEVLEHVRNPYDFIDEMFRVLKNNGIAIISVPNVLNINSRLSYLFTGFFHLFGPLSTDDKYAGNLSGHITPINYYYIDFGLRKSGFNKTSFHYDRIKNSSLFYYYMLFPLIKFFSNRSTSNIKKQDLNKPYQVYNDNINAIKTIASRDLICSRSAICVGYK